MFHAFLITLAMAATPAQRLDKAGSILSGEKVVKLEVTKSVKVEIMDKTTTSEGEIHLGRGKFRWETTSPEQSTIVFDGKTLWTLQPAIAELGGPAQVTKASIEGQTKDQILVQLLGGGKLSSKFKVLDTSKTGSGTLMKLAPAKPDQTVKDFALLLEGRPERIREIRYTDEIGNATTITIKKSSTVKKPSKDLFKFTPPKDAEVTEL